MSYMSRVKELPDLNSKPRNPNKKDKKNWETSINDSSFHIPNKRVYYPVKQKGLSREKSGRSSVDSAASTKGLPRKIGEKYKKAEADVSPRLPRQRKTRKSSTTTKLRKTSSSQKRKTYSKITDRRKSEGNRKIKRLNEKKLKEKEQKIGMFKAENTYSTSNKVKNDKTRIKVKNNIIQDALGTSTSLSQKKKELVNGAKHNKMDEEELEYKGNIQIYIEAIAFGDEDSSNMNYYDNEKDLAIQRPSKHLRALPNHVLKNLGANKEFTKPYPKFGPNTKREGKKEIIEHENTGNLASDNKEAQKVNDIIEIDELSEALEINDFTVPSIFIKPIIYIDDDEVEEITGLSIPKNCNQAADTEKLDNEEIIFETKSKKIFKILRQKNSPDPSVQEIIQIKENQSRIGQYVRKIHSMKKEKLRQRENSKLNLENLKIDKAQIICKNYKEIVRGGRSKGDKDLVKEINREKDRDERSQKKALKTRTMSNECVNSKDSRKNTRKPLQILKSNDQNRNPILEIEDDDKKALNCTIENRFNNNSEFKLEKHEITKPEIEEKKVDEKIRKSKQNTENKENEENRTCKELLYDSQAKKSPEHLNINANPTIPPTKPKYKELFFEKMNYSKNQIEASFYEERNKHYSLLTDEYMGRKCTRLEFLDNLCPEGNFKDDKVQDIEYLSWNGVSTTELSNYYFRVRWQPRPDGTQKQPSLVPWEDLKREAPKGVLKYVFQKLMKMMTKFGTLNEM